MYAFIKVPGASPAPTLPATAFALLPLSWEYMKGGKPEKHEKSNSHLRMYDRKVVE